MTYYSDLKARLRAVFDLERISSEVDHVLIDALTYIEELEQRIQSMGGSSDAGSASAGMWIAEAGSRKVEPATSVEHATLARSGEPPAQSSAAPAPEPVAKKWDAETRKLAADWIRDGAAAAREHDPSVGINADPELASLLEHVALEVKIGERPITKRPHFCMVRGCAAWHFDDGPDCPDKKQPWCALYAAPQPAQADEALAWLDKRIGWLTEELRKGGNYDHLSARIAEAQGIRAYLARTGGKEAK